jgi:hypothetical protein
MAAQRIMPMTVRVGLGKMHHVHSRGERRALDLEPLAEVEQVP